MDLQTPLEGDVLAHILLSEILRTLVIIKASISSQGIPQTRAHEVPLISTLKLILFLNIPYMSKWHLYFPTCSN